VQNVCHELAALSRALEGIEIPPDLSHLRSRLRDINERLWQIEDSIRDKEARKEFDQEFIDLARSVYITNDERGRIKRQINELLKSRLMEEKQYTPY
jgi:predicted  nucleic acid-binding Zn-ribbon protein